MSSEFHALSVHLCLSCSIYQEAAAFLKKRASIEEEYGKSLQKLSRSTADTYSMSDGKAGCVIPSMPCLLLFPNI